MNWNTINKTSRYVMLALLLGLFTSVIVVGAVLLAAYNFPGQSAASEIAGRLAGQALLVFAALLATAPLIEWWYNHLSEWLIP